MTLQSTISCLIRLTALAALVVAICASNFSASSAGETAGNGLNKGHSQRPALIGDFTTDSQETPVRPGIPENTFRSEPLKEIWVFLNGAYLPPPYTVQVAAGRVSVNGHELAASTTSKLAEIATGARYVADEEPGPGQETRRDQATRIGMSAAGLIENSYRQFYLIWDDCHPVIVRETGLGFELLTLLLHETDDIGTVSGLLNSLSKEQQATVTDWITGFEPSAEFSARARHTVDMIRQADAENRRVRNAVRLMNQLNYPMSIASMVLCVFAVGHLLQHPPPEPAAARSTPRERALVHRSLGLVAAFSTLDLIWTVLTHSAGVMRETNPIAASLADQPVELAAFKIVLTAFAVGTIARLWRHRTAQVAAWWACLILTLLTARWLTVNSALA